MTVMDKWLHYNRHAIQTNTKNLEKTV